PRRRAARRFGTARAGVLAADPGTSAANMPGLLALGRRADAWLGSRVRCRRCTWVGTFLDEGYIACAAEGAVKLTILQNGVRPDPTPAIVHAMMAADSAFREKMEGAPPRAPTPTPSPAASSRRSTLTARS